MITVQPMSDAHLDDVAEIERRCFPEDPWSRSLFMDALERENNKYLVASDTDVNDSVMGFIGMSIVGDEAHIDNLGVHPEYRRRGIGTSLVIACVDNAREIGVRNMTLEVSVENHVAQVIYQRLGFVPAGVRRNYYEVIGHDALVYWLYDLDARNGKGTS